MIILGIDPGSTRAGYGIIDFGPGIPRFVDGGIIKVSSQEKNIRLVELEEQFKKILRNRHLDAAGIERLYFVKNLKTGLEVAQSRGVLILCLSKKKIPLYEWTPSEVKQAVTGYGSADKKSVEKMIRVILKIEDLKQPDDVYDALAVALVTGYTILNPKLQITNFK
ncbi:MAG: Crossover junction endodeoxyribonuclease RuvC [Candidatus Wolfebacteria bacterium GW2011_GWC1_43_10]|uniref:Crossover junction endodeoxyribonuclease RuvC n=1 Tax=Candidatus Wolfebacteria bacterium GW2011_GWC1_43_10 TaxID=1619011 RepID=A0A0G1EHL4_9BACT|nr:MAG: Crossover junction endodeoxyribonuclease RuvC [Candidatus Wolfebacteria bacterium GW2011_GWC1_43_10]KKT23126.1 MAG: Crossover junction endodeoxyribonuclease RuvC [Parcubacteria group bacterium GW2011_GWB1_43_8b]